MESSVLHVLVDEESFFFVFAVADEADEVFVIESGEEGDLGLECGFFFLEFLGSGAGFTAFDCDFAAVGELAYVDGAEAAGADLVFQ